MSEASFAELLEDSLVTIHNGEIVEGTVIGVKDNEIILNIGYKADGILTKNEYSNNTDVDLTSEVKPGDTMTVKVLKVNDGEGQVLLTYKRLQQDKMNERFQEAFENQEVLTGKVSMVLKGGLSVSYGEGRVFIPASLVSDMYERDLSKYQDQEVEFVLTEVNPRKRRIIGDRKQLIVAKKKKMQEELLSRIKVGMMVEGTVKNLTDFGAFIELEEGIDALLHVSQIAIEHVEKPSDVLKVGQEITAKIVDFNEETKKISLSVKALEIEKRNEAADVEDSEEE